jgi:hypothetical protein
MRKHRKLYLGEFIGTVWRWESVREGRVKGEGEGE